MSLCWVQSFIIMQYPPSSLARALDLKLPLSDINIVSPASFQLLFSRYFSSLLSLAYLPSYLKWNSSGEYIAGSCFYYQPDHHCLFITVLRLFTLETIIDMFGYKYIILLVDFHFFSICSFSPFLFLCPIFN